MHQPAQLQVVFAKPELLQASDDALFLSTPLSSTSVLSGALQGRGAMARSFFPSLFILLSLPARGYVAMCF